MDSTVIISIAVFIIALVIGFAIAKALEKKNASKIILNAQNSADTLLKNAMTEAENIKKEKIYQAKEKFLELKAEHEKTINAKDKKMAEAEKRIRDKESQVSNELAQNKRLKEELETKKKKQNTACKLSKKSRRK